MSSTERAAAARTGAGRIGAVGPVLAVLLLALAVVLGREAVIGLGWASGSLWIPSAADSLDGLAPSGVLVVVCCVAIVLGAWLIVTGFGRRSRRGIEIAGSAGVHLSTRDVARLASGAARRCDGVLEARTTANRKSVTVAVQATSANVAADVAQAVTTQLAPLARAPRVRVRVNAPEVLS